MTRKFTDKTLLVATHNAGKLEEIVSLLVPYGISVKGAADLNLPEPRNGNDVCWKRPDQGARSSAGNRPACVGR